MSMWFTGSLKSRKKVAASVVYKIGFLKALISSLVDINSKLSIAKSQARVFTEKFGLTSL